MAIIQFLASSHPRRCCFPTQPSPQDLRLIPHQIDHRGQLSGLPLAQLQPFQQRAATKLAIDAAMKLDRA